MGLYFFFKLLSFTPFTAGRTWLQSQTTKGLFLVLIFLNSSLITHLFTMLQTAKQRMFLQVSGVVSFKCESVATLDPVTFDTPESFVALSKWTAKKAGSISFDFRTTEPNGLMLFSHGKPRQQQRKDPRTPPTVKVETIVWLIN